LTRGVPCRLRKSCEHERSSNPLIFLPIRNNAISAGKCYIINDMTKPVQSKTAERIRLLARSYHIAYAETASDRLAHHITRLAGDTVEFDEIERLLIVLQRAGHLSRSEMIHLQAQYLREAKP
jgi:hypothetical protein